MCITVPNFVKISQTVVEISKCFDFQYGSRLPSLSFKFLIFTCATLCYRGYMLQLRHFRLSVCLSVSLSHVRFLLKRLNISSKFFYHLIAPSFLFFVTESRCLTPMASPLMGLPNNTWVEKNCTMFGHSCYISRIGTIPYRMVSLSMTLSDPTPSWEFGSQSSVFKN